MPDLPECQTCEFNRTIWQSQRGMLLMFASTILFLMWAISSYLETVTGIKPDMTIITIFGGAVTLGFGFFFYSKTKTDAANIENQRMQATICSGVVTPVGPYSSSTGERTGP
jgi:hypothetical protein